MLYPRHSSKALQWSTSLIGICVCPVQSDVKHKSQFMASEAEYTFMENQQGQVRFEAEDDEDDFLKATVDTFDVEMPSHSHGGGGLEGDGGLEVAGADFMEPAALAPSGWEEDGEEELGLGLGVDDEVHLRGLGGGHEDAAKAGISAAALDGGAAVVDDLAGADVAFAGCETSGGLIDAAMDEPLGVAALEKFSPGKLLSTPESEHKRGQGAGFLGEGGVGSRWSVAAEQLDVGLEEQPHRQLPVGHLFDEQHVRVEHQQQQLHVSDEQHVRAKQQQLQPEQQQQQPPPPPQEQQQQHLQHFQPSEQQQRLQQEQQQHGSRQLNGIPSRETPFVSGPQPLGVPNGTAPLPPPPTAPLPPPPPPAIATAAAAGPLGHGLATLSGPLDSIPSLRHQGSLGTSDRSSLGLVLQRSPAGSTLMPSLQGITAHINSHRFSGLSILPFGFKGEQLHRLQPLLSWAREAMGADVLVGEVAAAAIAGGGRDRKVHILVLEGSVLAGGLEVLEKEVKLPIKDFLVRGTHVVVEPGLGAGVVHPMHPAVEGFLTACRQSAGGISKSTLESCSLYAFGELLGYGAQACVQKAEVHKEA